MRNAFMNTIIDACKERDDIFIVSGDAGLGVFDDFKETCSEKFLNLGVAEQNTASFSAGLSMTGYKVYVYNIIPFVLYRCYEQVRNDICYQELPVVLVGIGSGITYSPQGMTHYSVEDIGIARTLPNLTIISPADPVEARAAALHSLKSNCPVYVRLAKRGEPVIHHRDIDITMPIQIGDGKDVAIVFYGSIGSEVIRAKELLEKEGISPALISVPMLHPLNFDCLFETLKGFTSVITVEEHFVDEGLGGILSREYAKRTPVWKLYTIGIPSKFIHEIKDQDGMRDLFGISGIKLADFVKKIVH